MADTESMKQAIMCYMDLTILEEASFILILHYKLTCLKYLQMGYRCVIMQYYYYHYWKALLMVRVYWVGLNKSSCGPEKC